MTDQHFVAFTGVYSSLDDAKSDFSELSKVMNSGDVRKMTAALVSKDDKGKVHVREITEQGREGGLIGVVSGLILGAIFPPAGFAVLSASLMGGVSLGLIGGAIGHFSGGVSRKDLRDLGDTLYEGEASIVAVAINAVAEDVEKALSHAVKRARKDVNDDDVDGALTDLEKGLNKATNVLENA